MLVSPVFDGFDFAAQQRPVAIMEIVAIEFVRDAEAIRRMGMEGKPDVTNDPDAVVGYWRCRELL